MPLQGVQPKKDCVHFAQNRVKSKTQEHLQKRSVSYAIKEEVCHHCFSQIRVFFLKVEEARSGDFHYFHGWEEEFLVGIAW